MKNETNINPCLDYPIFFFGVWNKEEKERGFRTKTDLSKSHQPDHHLQDHSQVDDYFENVE
jgi:hypothetical protein